MNDIKELEKWFESHPDVVNADCQIFYFPKGFDDKGERTITLSVITFDDEIQWHDVSTISRVDFRNNPGPLISSTKTVFERHLKTRG